MFADTRCETNIDAARPHIRDGASILDRQREEGKQELLSLYPLFISCATGDTGQPVVCFRFDHWLTDFANVERADREGLERR